MTKTILVIGAGRSTPWLIRYLAEHASVEGWSILVADRSLELAKERVDGLSCAAAMALDVHADEDRRAAILKADIVISMLPSHMHIEVAKDCIQQQIPMVTASYVSDEMASLDADAVAAGVTIMNEVGVDPGLDHVSALRLLEELRSKGLSVVRFESFTGGLLAPESEVDNPWKYKFTWNPRNVVRAGAGATVKFIQEGQYKYIPYHRLFQRTEVIDVPGAGRFEGYANRDSLKYRKVYGLEDISTMYRGTLRRPGFSRAWNVFVQLGMTDDSYMMEGVSQMTHRDFLNSFLLFDPNNSLELKLMHYLKLDYDAPELTKIAWLGLFDEEPVGLTQGTPADVLEHILQKKWAMLSEDRDMIVMFHKVHYMEGNERKQRESSMVVEGEDRMFTAMAKTVGLPTGIAAKMILSGSFAAPGVHRPTSPQLYLPALKELEKYGIAFLERDTPVRYETMF